ncbi:MAG: 1,4-dihydroxy-2-naphthoate polyprenyltransferase [Nitriliruptorales bacterium]|nr:1,4-dihydroxy-2-naphthoate polyprenyltransferase [Nitriliruptorales bacterium]
MNHWIEAARPRTLPAAVVPVAVGTAASARPVADLHLGRAALALLVALALQVAVNFANDLFDGVRGVDTAARQGPRRAVASGLITPAAMRNGVGVALSVAGVAGLVLAALTTWWLVAVGFACGLAALGYSGGPRPYASAALGEVFVFVFFGVVATVGSQWVQDETLLGLSWVAAVPVGLLAVALLVVNNLRDIPTDEAAGKRTLAVVLGDARTRRLFALLVRLAIASGVAVALAGRAPWALLVIVLGVPAWRSVIQPVLEGAAGRDLVPVLEATARLHLANGLVLTVGLLLRAH